METRKDQIRDDHPDHSTVQLSSEVTRKYEETYYHSDFNEDTVKTGLKTNKE